MTRSLLRPVDLAVWLWTILFRGTAIHPYNVGSDQEITIARLADTVASTLGGAVSPHAPSTWNLNFPASRYVPDLKNARTLGLKVQIPLIEAIRKTAQWHGLR